MAFEKYNGCKLMTIQMFALRQGDNGKLKNWPKSSITFYPWVMAWVQSDYLQYLGHRILMCLHGQMLSKLIMLIWIKQSLPQNSVLKSMSLKIWIDTPTFSICHINLIIKTNTRTQHNANSFSKFENQLWFKISYGVFLIIWHQLPLKLVSG